LTRCTAIAGPVAAGGVDEAHLAAASQPSTTCRPPALARRIETRYVTGGDRAAQGHDGDGGQLYNIACTLVRPWFQPLQPPPVIGAIALLSPSKQFP
jgi:hypothetical protein